MESPDLKESTVCDMAFPLRRSRSSRRDRNRKAEEDAQQRLTGDAHWSKLLQVNGSDADMKLVRRLSAKRNNAHARNRSREPSAERPAKNGGTSGGNGTGGGGGGGGGGMECGGGGGATCGGVSVVTHRPRHGLLAAITSRIRHWLQSRRKYEISPREQSLLNNSSSSGNTTPIKGAQRHSPVPGPTDQVLDCDAALNRVGAGRLSPNLPQRLPNGYAAATAAETGKIPLQRSPVARRDQNKFKLSPVMPSKPLPGASSPSHTSPPASGSKPTGMSRAKSRSPVHIKIEVVDVSGHSPSPLSPSASRLLASSRRHLLRQSRSKLKERAVLVTSLVPTAASLTHQPLTTTISCPPQAETAPGVGGSDLAARRVHTWPLPRRKAIPEDEECPDSAKEEALQNAGLNGQESLEDCSIRFEDLELGECIKVGRRCKIYRARWHGDVFVHLFGELVKRPDREGFWRDVAKLCRIRHENINLFMGACTMAPNMAVITSYVTGKSLFEHIHIKREKMTLHTRVQILQGVAQGMGYLHAKGIVLRKLNTSNIFLTPRVKVSAIDFSLPEARHNRKDYASIPRGHLTYVAPELLSTLRVIPPRLVPTAAPSPETDVFAFGTIMYEVLGGSYPYKGFSPESVIWSVCSGHRQNLANVNCTLPLKTLIEDCWSHEPLYRPDFPELSKELHRNSPQYKRHSSSEPERLNRSPGVFD